VIVQDLIRVIFEDMNLIWSKSMWGDGETTRAYVIEIFILGFDLLIFL
jgi:hypothetical protein